MNESLSHRVAREIVSAGGAANALRLHAFGERIRDHGQSHQV